MMQCEPATRGQAELEDDHFNEEQHEYIRQRLEDEYYTMLATIVSPNSYPTRPPTVRVPMRQPNLAPKRSSANFSPDHSSSAKRMRPAINRLQPVEPLYTNVPSFPPAFPAPFVEHVVSMES